MSIIIKEAIADANTVTSVIEERAKNMFIKEFSPQIKNMLSAVINEEISPGSDQPGGYNPEEDQDAMGDGTNINKKAGAGPIETYPEGKDVNEEEALPIDGEDELGKKPEDEFEGMDAGVPAIEDDDKELEELFGEPDDKKDVIGAKDDDEVLEVVDDEEDEAKKPEDEAKKPEDEAKKKEDETIEKDGDGSDLSKDEVLEQVKKIARKYKKENAILREAVNTLRSKFEKVDLFNAKLAYAFKLMTQPGMTRNDKKQIAEAFDAAKTTREAQLIYKTMKRTPPVAKVAKNPLKNVNQKSVISESTKLKNIQVDRMSELAGL
jgi:hypothetical protein